MKAIIVGGGKVGYFLVKTILANKIQVVLIEKDPERARQISDELNIEVLQGDGSDIAILEEAGMQDAEIVAAVTGNDEENLVVCQIIKARFPKQKTIARINNPKNVEMFKSLGVDKTVCSTKVIADLIDTEISTGQVKIIQTFERGNMVLAEVVIDKKCAWANMLVKDLKIHTDLVLVSIMRDDEVIYPKGETKILVGDHVMAISSNQAIEALKREL